MEVLHDIKRIKELIDNASTIVFLGGAGISTESGIPDFRSPNGLYNQPYKFSPEKILSHNFFLNQPKIFYEFYKENIINFEANPNFGHIYLAILETTGKLKTIITQNIDGLHQIANSKHVLELHGNVSSNHCVKCNKEFDIEYIKNSENPVRCDACNGLVKPDVVLYGEMISNDIMKEAIKSVSEADLLIVGGTSLSVYPASGLIRYAKKKILINTEKTSKDIFCDYVYYGKFGELCQKLNDITD